MGERGVRQAGRGGEADRGGACEAPHGGRGRLGVLAGGAGGRRVNRGNGEGAACCRARGSPGMGDKRVGGASSAGIQFAGGELDACAASAAHPLVTQAWDTPGRGPGRALVIAAAQVKPLGALCQQEQSATGRVQY